MDTPSLPEPEDPEVLRLRERIALLEAALAEATRRADDLAKRSARDALEHAQTVAREQEARAFLDTLIATTAIGIGFVDAELRFAHINASLAAINGPSPAEHLGRRLDEIVPELAPQLVPLYRHVLTTGEAIRDLEVRGSTPATPDQLRVWLANYFPVPGASGQVAGVGIAVLDITERTQAEEALQQQAETLREQAAALDLAHIITRDAESRIVAWNQGAELLYGWSGREALGQLSHQLLQTRFPVSREAYEAQLLEEGAWEGELVHRRKDGGEIVVASHQVLYRDPEGRPHRIIEVNNDITALKRVEQALREREAQLSLAHETAELGTWRHDFASGRIQLRPRAQAHYGFTSDSITLADMYARIHPDDLPRFQEASAHASDPAGDHRSSVEYRVVRPDGTMRWLALRSQVHYDETGATFAVGASQDITARKQAEEELRRMAERLRILNTIDRAILTAQTPRQIAGVVVTRLRQLVPCERIVVSTYDPERQHIERLAFFDARPERTGQVGFIPIEPRDLLPPFPLGERWYVPDVERAGPVPPRAIPHQALGFRSLLHFPLIAEGQLLGLLRLGKEQPDAFTTGDLSIAGDVADQLAIALRGAQMRAQVDQERAQLARRVAERTADLSAANAQLARSARVKDEFLSNMSHELRTPLNAILGRAELLREQIYGPLTARQDGALESIAEAGQHLLTLINDILDLSKVEAGKLTLDLARLEVSAIAPAALRLVSQMATSKRIALRTTYDSRVETVVADERRLKQILVNLLSNAVKFTPEGGQVGLEIQADPAQQVVTFCVWDTGIGIAPEDQTRLFQPFVQIDSSLNREREGTGLGLALVLRLAELHGGSVTLESSPGQGSRFSVALPWSEQTAPTADEPAPQAESAPGASLAIRQTLVIEDSQTVAEQLCRYLGDLGSQVEVHDRASGAVERARALQPDLIVLDVLLPDQLGWDVLRQLKADPRTATIPVLVSSVVDDPAQAQAMGAAGFLLKPLTRDRFLEALRQLRVPAESVEPLAISLALVVVANASAPRPLVLLVDDNEANLQVLVDYLPTAGYEVIVARNGAEAVALAEELSPAVILMDIQMPVMDGLEATRRIRAAGLHEMPILALTALAMTGDRERCLAAGANAYLAKPVSLRTLTALIREQIDEATGGSA